MQGLINFYKTPFVINVLLGSKYPTGPSCFPVDVLKTLTSRTLVGEIYKLGGYIFLTSEKKSKMMTLGGDLISQIVDV